LLDAFPMRVLNIHPALLPAFPGVDAQRQAIEYGVKVTGCTVHLVDGGTDTGPIVAQRAIPVHEGEDVETLRARLLEVEHSLLTDVLQQVAEGRVEVRAGGAGRTRVVVKA
jgi:phosphoribosylglycinamide formyltransferase-1